MRGNSQARSVEREPQSPTAKDNQRMESCGVYGYGYRLSH